MPFGYRGERDAEFKRKIKKEHIDKFFLNNPTNSITEQVLKVILRKLFPEIDKAI